MTPADVILNTQVRSTIIRDGAAVGTRAEIPSPALTDAILKALRDAGLVIVQRDVAAQAVAHLTDFATSAAMGARLAGPRPDVEGVRNHLRAAIEGKP